jgi:hypothetical protein
VEYGFESVAQPPPLGDAFALVREEEGFTLIGPGEGWARITLTVDSSLNAVGLTARVAAVLASHGIAANLVAGLHHDHLFVPWAQRQLALTLLRGLSDE